jgi:UDP-N-acetylglucosamine transferase subunit ALG13
VIFVTVGTQLPFDRMIAAVDRWAGAQPERDVFAQVGPTKLALRHIAFCEFLTPAECRERMAGATAIVAHAGMGTVLCALELGKPLLIVPRRATLGEHRNEHQLATARRFAEHESVAVALDEHELSARLDALGQQPVGERISPYASQRLIGALWTFIDAPPEPERARTRTRARIAVRRNRERAA